MKRRRRRSRKFPFKRLLLFILLAAVCFIWADTPWIDGISKIAGRFAAARPAAESLFNAAPSAAESKIFASNTVSAASRNPSGAPGYYLPVHVDDVTDTRCLELVNGGYAIAREPDMAFIVPAWPTAPVSARSVTLHETALEAVEKLFEAAREAQIGAYYVSSGYRSFAEQSEIYEATPNKSFVQPPNHSEHQTGFAADILATGISQSEMAASREGRWLAENAWKYGLLLRYPQGKQDVTGISYEPWHFRYVGQPHAWYCHQNNLCLEEYVEFLKAGGGYSVATGDMPYSNKSYSVLYEIPENGIILVPENGFFNISRDNTGGYIITAWEEM